MSDFVVVGLLLFRCCFLVVCVCLCVALALLMRVSSDQRVSDLLFHCSCKVVDVSSFVVRVVLILRIVVTCLLCVFVLLSCSCVVVELLLFVFCLCVVIGIHSLYIVANVVSALLL